VRADTGRAVERVNRRTYSIEEAATVLGISRSAAYRAAARGEIPVLVVGRRKLVPAARLRELLGESA
jgi:excisionase family DNA binding protein